MNALLAEFQNFWRHHSHSFPLRVNQADKFSSESVVKDSDINDPFDDNSKKLESMISKIRRLLEHKYDEAAYSFILMSFLQRIVSGGAQVLREYAQGCGSVDLCIIFNDFRYFLEIKIKGQKSLNESLHQLAGYLNTGQEKEGWLVIIDPCKKGEWDKKIYYKEEKYENYTIHIFGC
jgi:hypothetical protein